MVESLSKLRDAEKLKGEKTERMGAMEQVNGEEDEADASSKKGEASVISNTMRRAASVDDLFAPMWQLNVQSSATAPSSSHQSVTSVAVSSSSAKAPAAVPQPHALRIAEGRAPSSVAPQADCREAGANGLVSSSPPKPSPAGNRTSDTQRLVIDSKVQQVAKKEEARSKRTGREKPLEGSSSSHSSEPEVADVKPSSTGAGADPRVLLTAKNERKGTACKASSGEAADPLPPSNSTSDDDQHAGGIDERKQKRMLSNRESARRSRLRKQQHLDELRAQVAQLRAENHHMLTKYSIASQRYDYLTKENRELRSHAMSLTSQLQRLHQTAAQHPGGLRALGLQPGHLDPAPYGTMSSSHHSPYSMVPDMLH